MIGKHRGPGGRRSVNITYVAIIAVAAIIIIAAVVLIFTGSSGNAAGQSVSVPTTATISPSTSVSQKSGVSGKSIDSASIVVPTTVSIANTGIFIRVQYLGAYTGSYLADGEVHEIQSSGDRLFKVENSSQTVSVTVKKADRSTKQTLTAEIWKDGNLLKSANTTALFGEVDVSAAV